MAVFFFLSSKKNIDFYQKNGQQPSVILMAFDGSFFFWANYGVALGGGVESGVKNTDFEMT